jgi:hypothetical protein
MLTRSSKTRSSMMRGTFLLGATLAVEAFGMPSAFASTNQLALPFYLQTESNWCAIACAKMILAYYGATVQECEEANYDFGQTGCCSTPSSSTCNPSSGSFTGTPLSYYGVGWTQYSSNNFTFTQFKSEIDAGRPVSIGWNWTAGGGHAMNVAGYDTNGSYLLFWDPAAGAGCPAGEDTCWMTWTAYMGGAGYNHTSQPPLYNIVNSPVCPSDYFDIAGSTMQQCYDTWTHRNKYPVALTTTTSSGSVLYSGSYQTQTGAGWAQYIGMTLSQYQSTFNTLTAENYRPAQVNLIEVSSTWYVNAIWQPAEGAFASYTGMSPSSFASTNSSLVAQGYVIVDLFGYNDTSNNPFFAATWVKRTSSGQSAQVGITAANYQSVFNSENAASRYPSRVSAYNSGGTIEYAVIWQNDAGGFASVNGWSEGSFVSQNSAENAGGLHLRYVSALNNAFSGTWTQ